MRRASWRSVPSTCRPPERLHLLVVQQPLAVLLRDRRPVLLFRGLGAGLLPRAELGVAAELDVRAAARHVRGNGDRAVGAGIRDDHGLAGVVLRVQHLVADAAGDQHPGELLRLLDGDGADEDGLALLVQVRDGGADGVQLLLLREVDLVVVVVARHRPVGRDDHDVQVVDLAELLRLGVRRARHAGELAVHAEVVLEGDGGQRPVARGDLDPFLGLDGLVQSLGVAPAVEDAAGELVHDLHLAVLHDVVHVLGVQLVGAQGLGEVVDELEVLVDEQGARG